MPKQRRGRHRAAPVPATLAATCLGEQPPPAPRAGPGVHCHEQARVRGVCAASDQRCTVTTFYPPAPPPHLPGISKAPFHSECLRRRRALRGAAQAPTQAAAAAGAKACRPFGAWSEPRRAAPRAQREPSLLPPPPIKKLGSPCDGRAAAARPSPLPAAPCGPSCRALPARARHVPKHDHQVCQAALLFLPGFPCTSRPALVYRTSRYVHQICRGITVEESGGRRRCASVQGDKDLQVSGGAGGKGLRGRRAARFSVGGVARRPPSRARLSARRAPPPAARLARRCQVVSRHYVAAFTLQGDSAFFVKGSAPSDAWPDCAQLLLDSVRSFGLPPPGGA